MVGERPDVGALRLRRAHRRPNDPERGQTTRESGREPDESSKSGCSTDTAIAAIGSKSRILNSLLKAFFDAQPKGSEFDPEQIRQTLLNAIRNSVHVVEEAKDGGSQ